MPSVVATFLGLENPESYTGHSLRATGATLISEHGGTENDIIGAGNWQSIKTAQVYMRRTHATAVRRATIIDHSMAEGSGSEEQKQQKQDPQPLSGEEHQLSDKEKETTEQTSSEETVVHLDGVFYNCIFKIKKNKTL